MAQRGQYKPQCLADSPGLWPGLVPTWPPTGKVPAMFFFPANSDTQRDIGNGPLVLLERKSGIVIISACTAGPRSSAKAYLRSQLLPFPPQDQALLYMKTSACS